MCITSPEIKTASIYVRNKCTFIVLWNIILSFTKNQAEALIHTEKDTYLMREAIL